MAIDTDIQSFAEYNANVTDANNKFNAFWGLVGQTPTATDTNKVVIERSNIWKYEGEERYNGLFQLFGNLSGNVSLSINSSSGRTAVLATITGNTFVTDFCQILSLE